ncbi:hypothetical protein C0993_010342 [Termitomyces sp. T159_Od127]|nr:hypothetical protein C0993_010342 [Termitomyces sp. T159_Od127]
MRRYFPKQTNKRHDPIPPVIPQNEHEREYLLSEAQTKWNDIFQESLRDFQLKFEEEEMARSVGERARQDKFDLTMLNFGDIFLENHLRRQELYEKTDALREQRFQMADAAREAIFVQAQQERAHAFEIDEETHGKQAEWYSLTRKGLFNDGRQRLAEKCDALKAALVEQFDRLMERQKEMMEVAEEQSSDQDTVSFGDD